MKKRAFSWGWEDRPLQPDPLMTSERALNLFRSWFRATTQGRRVFALERLATHCYRVTHADTGEQAVISWRDA